MKRQHYYPRAHSARPEWHLNFATKLPGYAAALPLDTEDVNQGVADNLTLAYGQGTWLTNVRDFAPACTASLRELEDGAGNSAFVFPVFTAPTPPTLPVGITVKPGALQRIYRLVQDIKSKPGYTEAMGIDLGIVGPEDTVEITVPEFSMKLEQGTGCQCVRLSFKKHGWYAVAIYSRRGDGDWVLLGIDSESPYLDERPLLVPSQPEVREYRMRYWEGGTEQGDWTAVQSITVGV
ncbi:MAG: hypothetical protein JNJ83_22830 [Verrucomicrobiaceae bacterium]|nr:hypothetical protein [Verrucomicrobiaceae bacterium]